jgi:excisionase family DNA binding protein
VLKVPREKKICLVMTRDTREANEEPKQLLTVNQLAYRWQVSPRTIRRRIKNGKIPVIRIGRAVRIHPKVAAKGSK